MPQARPKLPTQSGSQIDTTPFSAIAIPQHQAGNRHPSVRSDASHASPTIASASAAPVT
jgi:hypothetical protein